MKFGKLILRIIIKIVATTCHMLKLKCTKFDFSWVCAPDPTGSLQRSCSPRGEGKGGRVRASWEGREGGMGGEGKG